MSRISAAGQETETEPALTKQRVFLFSALCCLVYFTSYMTRLNYGAAISEIADSLAISNQAAGMALIGGFIAYGAGQPIFGLLGDRVKPRYMITAGLTATAVCNLAVSALHDISVITVVWCFNGFFQAMLWPPLVRIMAQTLTSENYRRASVSVFTASSAGTIAVYLLVPLCIWLSGWRLAFVATAALGLGIAAVWFVGVKGFAVREWIVDEKAVERPVRESTGALVMASGLLPIMLVVVLQGALRDGITTWMPTYLNEVYRFGNSISILSTAILPVFAIVSVSAASFVQRLIGNELKTVACIWGIALAAAAGLTAVYASNAAASLLLMALLTSCANGINLLLISRLPMHFAQYGRISTVSGLLNAFAYLGSAVSIYGIAAISHHFGWKATIVVWGVIALIGMLLCALCVRKWGRFTAGGPEKVKVLRVSVND
ncbi:MFS transporter [Paenibacillus arenilitoris]|uniref:MFS transporter n=1 Tax=Paenibacillus arenilitoris TaxID=2772299 RepID=A0A927H8B8_9BACL|nr:MFS transporter [Paenibacillus arenilitoris]MBD2871910.1 MFS transporter [Paenibacillus arenilitoris]